jgi:hypothetical protein
MDFFTTDLDGITLMVPGPVDRREILLSVQQESDADYPEVYLNARNGIVIGYRAGGILLWEEAGRVTRTASGIDLNKAAEAWTWLVEGELSHLEALPWEVEERPE